MEPTQAAAPRANPANRFAFRVEQVDGFEFRVKFDKDYASPLVFDEPPPIGRGRAAGATHVLAAAVANCLAASLLFSLQKAKVEAPQVNADVEVEMTRSATRRLRIGKVNVTLHTNLGADHPALAGCIATFEDFCTVTQSVRHGIDVAVRVESQP